MASPLADVDLKSLKVFCTIVECGGFSGAQIALNTSQPAISKHISHLEVRLGQRLCNRGRRGFSITEDGDTVYAAAKALFAAMDDFQIRVSSTAKELFGELRIGLIDNTITNGNSRIAKTISQFMERSEKLELNLKINSSSNLEAGVMDGTYHLAMGIFHSELPNLCYQPLFTETHQLYCGKHHPLFTVKCEKKQEELLPETKYASVTQLTNTFTDIGIPLNECATSPNIEGIAYLLFSGKYIGYLPAHYAQAWVEQGLIKPLLPTVIQQKSTCMLITAKGKQLTHIAEAFIDDLLSNHTTPL